MTHTFAKGDKVRNADHGKGVVIGISLISGNPVVEYKKPFDGAHDGNPFITGVSGKAGLCFIETAARLTLRTPKRPWQDGHPADTSNVQVKLSDGRKWYGFWGYDEGDEDKRAWFIMGDEADRSKMHQRWYVCDAEIAEPNEVIAWRPLKAKPAKVAPAAPVVPERIPVGAKVIVRGTLVADDHDKLPYLVRLTNGEDIYLKAELVELAE